jgi:hypothetical protein
VALVQSLVLGPYKPQLEAMEVLAAIMEVLVLVVVVVNLAVLRAPLDLESLSQIMEQELLLQMMEHLWVEFNMIPQSHNQ